MSDDFRSFQVILGAHRGKRTENQLLYDQNNKYRQAKPFELLGLHFPILTFGN